MWNGRFQSKRLHPLFVLNRFGDLERCALRPGNGDFTLTPPLPFRRCIALKKRPATEGPASGSRRTVRPGGQGQEDVFQIGLLGRQIADLQASGADILQNFVEARGARLVDQDQGAVIA